MSRRKSQWRTTLGTVAAVVGAFLLSMTTVYAQPSADTTATIQIDVREFPLVDAIQQLIDQTDLDIGYDPKLLHWKTSNCAISAPDIESAITCILAGTGLTYRKLSSGGYVIVRPRKGQAKSSHTVSGFLQDAQTGENFVGANIHEPNRHLGTASNAYGFYSLTLPVDSATIIFSYIGYEARIVNVVLTANLKLDIALEPALLSSDSVVVEAERSVPIEERTQMSTVEIPIRQVESMPTILGETDLIKAFQLMPGVRGGSEGSSGLFVRGGSADQTLILLDGATVYNASHFFGLFSVFNAAAVRNAKLIKGGFPARYGGRLSSVLDVGMKEGNMKSFGGEFAIGAVASRLMVEGPIAKDRTSFLVSGRRTYIDQLIRPFQSDEEKAGMYFYDLNAKINHKLSTDDRLYFSVYRGNDRFRFEERRVDDRSDGFIQWGNLTSTVRWNRVISSKLFGNLIGTFSDYGFDIKAEEEDFRNPDNSFQLAYTSGIRDYTVKADLDYLPTPDHFVRFGASGTNHTFSPGATVIQVDLSDNTDQPFGLKPADQINSWEFAGYVEDDFRVNDLLKVNLGIHASAYRVDQETFSSIEPRVSLRYLLPNGWGLKASYARMQQYVLLLTNGSIGLPTDLWLPATSRVPPQKSQQVAAGVSTSIVENLFEFSVEGYYKQMDGLIEYKSGASFLGIDEDWQDKVEIGEGRSFGIELLLQKKAGRTTGWLGYSLSNTDRRFEDLNNGEWFPFRYDARHDFALVVMHNIRPGIELSGNWVYTTGNAVSLPTTLYYAHPYVEAFSCFGCTVKSFDQRGNYRQRAHHRLDVAVNFHKTTHRGRIQTITIGAYNAYNHMNPFFVNLEDDGSLNQVTLFPIMPYVTYRRAF
jgi:hypothetical protein